MAEGDINYASVVFKTKKQPRQEAQKEEETVYDEVRVANQAPEQHPDANAGFLPDKKADSRHGRYQQLACGFGTLCVLLLLGIIAIIIYLSTLDNVSDVSQLNQLKDNQTTLMAVNHNLTNTNNKLSSENENLRRNYAVLENNITNLTAKNSNLAMKIQELEMSKNNLTEQIQTMKTNWNKLNTSRAQWSIDTYCPGSKGSERQCTACKDQWKTFESNCYAINNAERENLRTWKGAQEDCRGKNSDLVVVVSEAEKNFVNDNSWPSEGLKRYWIGLRAEDNKWKWVDGTDLTDNSWMKQTPSDGLCAVSVTNEVWKAVSCNDKNRWICQMKALSV